MRIFKAKPLAALLALALLVLGAASAAAQSVPLAAHRAFYELVLESGQWKINGVASKPDPGVV